MSTSVTKSQRKSRIRAPVKLDLTPASRATTNAIKVELPASVQDEGLENSCESEAISTASVSPTDATKSSPKIIRTSLPTNAVTSPVDRLVTFSTSIISASSTLAYPTTSFQETALISSLVVSTPVAYYGNNLALPKTVREFNISIPSQQSTVDAFPTQHLSNISMAIRMGEVHPQFAKTEKQYRRKSRENGGKLGGDDCGDEGSRQQRLLMREWLIEQANRNDIPGLEWFDAPDNQLIRIPWIHGSKSGWSADYHCRLFELWAIYSGKYHPEHGEQPNPKRWKANFRCALNSLPMVKEEKHLSQKNGKDGFKVYKILPDKTKCTTNDTVSPAQIDGSNSRKRPNTQNPTNVNNNNRDEDFNRIQQRIDVYPQHHIGTSEIFTPSTIFRNRQPVQPIYILHSLPSQSVSTNHIRTPQAINLIPPNSHDGSDDVYEGISSSSVGGDDGSLTVVVCYPDDETSGTNQFTALLDVSEEVIGDVEEDEDEETYAVNMTKKFKCELNDIDNNYVERESDGKVMGQKMIHCLETKIEGKISKKEEEGSAGDIVGRNDHTGISANVIARSRTEEDVNVVIESKIPTCVTKLEEEEDT